MKRLYIFFGFILLMLPLVSAARGQGKETYTGTILYYGTGFNTRTVTRTFTLNINGLTSDSAAQNYLGILQESGQSRLLDAIRKQDLGRFSVGANVGIPVNVVRESTADGRRRIFIVFERLTQFAELRGGYRSLDYPFGVIELSIDERTGKCEGTYIAAAQIRWRHDDKTGLYQVEIENFATFPAKLLGVARR
ncbi:MAG: hypothetical protein ACR2N3_18905 [Pyrinomonadaceae bacterium]